MAEVDPRLVEALASRTAAVYADAEQRIVATIATRIRRRGYEPEFAIAKRDELRAIRKRAAVILEQARAAATASATSAVQQAAQAGATSALADLTALGLDTAALAGATAVDVLVREAVTGIVAGQVRVLRDVDDAYRAITTRAATGVITGAQTRREASQTALNRLADHGLTAFTDRAGRSWRLDSYAEMTVRTIAGHAMVQAQLDTLARAGQDLVYVSDSPRECPLCRPWEHKVLSISSASGDVQARNPVTGQLVTVDVEASVSHAVATGLLHPNCTHSLSLYLPGVTRLDPAAAEPEEYAASQQQRYLERQVRHWKRRRAAALDADAATRADRRVRYWQARIREHLDEHPDLKRLYYREQPGRAHREPEAVRGPHFAEERRGNPEHTNPLPPAPVDVEAPQTDPLAGIDLDTLSDEQIAELYAEHSGDDTTATRLFAEMDRRDQLANAPAETTPQPPEDAREWLDQGAALDEQVAGAWGVDLGALEETEESRRVADLEAQGVPTEEAVAEVYGITPEEQVRQRKAEVLVPEGLTSGTKAARAAQAYHEWVDEQVVAAEEATRGNLLNNAGRRAHINPSDLWSGSKARARKYATEELARWWVDHPRMTLTEFRAEFLGWESDRRKVEKIKHQGQGRDFGL